MHISKIELENIKSHAQSTFHFTRGTTAITGENGAGKTTIIEAIAWVLFDLLEYKKEDFVRRGAKKGVVRVTFESGLDEREYIVYRDTGAGYHVTDPRLQTRIAVKKEEVFRFLWQHLGLEPGTDLRSLFRQAIGVPQGTFTAIFLEGATERKVAFDRLLKVEEYRQAAEKLRETSRFLDTRIATVREDIARAEGELSRVETTEEEHKNLAEQAARLEAELETIGTNLSTKQSLVAALDTKEKQSATLRTAFERLKSEKEKAEIVLRQRELSVTNASGAFLKIDAVRPQSERHIEILGRLKELERERHERDRLRTELAKTEAALVNVKADQKRLLQDIENVQKAHAEIGALRPRSIEQETFEKEIAVIRDRVSSAKTTDSQIKSLDEKLERLRESFRVNQAQLKEADAKTAAAADIGPLEKLDAELLRSLANLRARLDSDEKFQSEIKNGLCPILSQKCLNLKDGETLEGFVASQFTDLRSQIAGLEMEHATATTNLTLAREAERFSTAILGYRERERELTAEGQRLRDEKASLEKHIEGLSDAKLQLAGTEAKLKELDDPRSRIRFLENEVKREIELRGGVTRIESNLERLENDRRITVEQFESYKDLDEHWGILTIEREATSEAHRTYLANEIEAKTLGDRQKQLDDSTNELSTLVIKVDAAEKELAEIGAGYDRALHTAEKVLLLEAERRHAQTHATFEPSFGITKNWELGGYFQTALLADGALAYAGAKLRSKLVTSPDFHPHARLGINVELAKIPRIFERNRWGAELRPIAAWEDDDWLFAFNPIFAIALAGKGFVLDEE